MILVLSLGNRAILFLKQFYLGIDYFDLFQCVSLATSFYCSNYVGLRIQTVVLMASSILAFISYYFSVGKFFSSIENASKRTSDVEIKK